MVKNKVSIVIVNYKTKKLTDECIKTFEEFHSDLDYEIILVDNDSRDGSVEYLQQENQNVNFIVNKINSGFSGGNNIGARKAKCEYILLLNSDTITLGPFLEDMVKAIQSDDTGVVGLTLKNKDLTYQVSYGYYPSVRQVFFEGLRMNNIRNMYRLTKPLGCIPHENLEQSLSVDYVSGACLLIKKDLWDSIGGLDEKFFMYFEELDLCYKVKKEFNRKIVMVKNNNLVHLGGGSFNSYSQDKIKYFYESYLYFIKGNYNKLISRIIRWELIGLNIGKLLVSSLHIKRKKMYQKALNTIWKTVI